MEEFMKADVFFFVTTIAVACVTVGVAVALYYTIKILRSVRNVSDRIEEGSKMLEEDFHTLRDKVKSGEATMQVVRAFLGRASRWISGPARKVKARAKTKEEPTQSSGTDYDRG